MRRLLYHLIIFRPKLDVHADEWLSDRLCGPSLALADGVIAVPLHVRDEKELGAATLGLCS